MFKSTGDEEENPVVCHSQKSLDHENDNINYSIPRFNPRPLKNLELRDEIQNIGPINDMRVEDLTNEGQN